MIIILDTSAAVEVVLKRKFASELADYIANANWVITPSLYVAEVTNVFWKYYQFSEMPLGQCEKAIEFALALPDEYFDEKEAYKEAFALGCLNSKPTYDMFFLVLARRNNGFLMTLDKSLKETARKNSIRVFDDN